METQNVDIGGRILSLRCAGTSPPGQPTVMFEQGLDASSSDWIVVQRAVAASARACAYDRAGTGNSDPAEETPRTAADLERDLYALLTAAEIEPPYIFVSHSIGPWVTTQYVAHRSDEVVGLVFVDPRGPAVTAQWVEALPPPADTEPASISEVRAWLEKGVDDNREHIAVRATETEIRALLEEDGPAFGDIRLIVLASEHARYEWPSLPGDVASEWLVAWDEGQRGYANESNHGMLTTVEGVGHMVHVGKPEAVIAAITELLGSP